MKKTVMVVDMKGRGAALIHKYAQSKHVGKLLAVPGNDLMKINTGKKPLKIYTHLKTTSVSEIIEICNRERVDLVDVAQDNAIEAGLINELNDAGITTIGPSRLAGQIEWDKAWSRMFCEKYKVPQPAYKVCHSKQEGIYFLKKQPNSSWFVKAAGLAEGKGVFPATNNNEAKERIKELKQFGKAGETYLIEEWLKNDDGTPGEEFSTFAVCDGKHYSVLGSAQDNKRVYNFDEGPNTGGMGCSSPPLILTTKVVNSIKKTIFNPVISGLLKEKRPYKGILYLGGMLVKKRGVYKSYVIEFNARWGDPEAQVILPGLKTDLFELSMAAAQENIRKIKIKTDGKTRIAVAGASRGYPGDYSSIIGKEIFGLSNVKRNQGVQSYSGAIKEKSGRYFVNGSRLFYMVGEGRDIVEARQRAYAAMSMIHLEENNLHFRTDIGQRDVQRLYTAR